MKDVLNLKKKFQLDATICRHLFTAKSLYVFRASQHPSSGALKNVTATSGIGHNTGTATSFQRGLLKKKTFLILSLFFQTARRTPEIPGALRKHFHLSSTK